MWLAQADPTSTLLKILDSAGSFGLLVVIIVAFIRGWVLTRATHNEQMAALAQQLATKSTESEEWKRMALRGAGLTEQIVDRTARIVRQVVVEQDPRVSRLDVSLDEDDG